VRTNETLEDILKDIGPIRLCKSICERQRAPCGEHELVALLSKQAAEHFNMPGDRAFAKLYESEESVRRACNIAKATYLDVRPVVVGGGEMKDEADRQRAMDQLREIGRKMAPTATPEKQFAIAIEDPKNIALALRAHQRPEATTSFAFPR
jgi:hypothetical protein